MRFHTAPALSALIFAALASSFPLSAAAGQSLAEAVRTPAQRLAALVKNAQQKAAAANAAGAIDNTAPVLSRFTVVKDVNAQAAIPALDVDMAISDELSGITTYIVSLAGPSGQSVQRVESLNGQLSLDGKVSIGAPTMASGTPSFSRFSQPGDWRVDWVFLSDANYNARLYWPEDLAAMGASTSFSVKNAKGYDVVAPTLIKARLETPKVSLSTPPPGTGAGTLPWVSVQLTTADTGNGVVSGTQDVIVEYCLMDKYSNCIDTIELQGRADQAGKTGSTLHATAQLRANQTPGAYQILNLYIDDAATNAVVLQNGALAIGGVDFSAYFSGNAVLTVKP